MFYSIKEKTTYMIL